MPNIITLSNYVPEDITDISRFNEYKPILEVPNYCTYAKNFTGRVIEDSEVDGAVIPNSCDSIRVSVDFISKSSKKFIHQLKHPLIISKDAVYQYANEILEYKKHFEYYFGTQISNDTISSRSKTLEEKYLFIHKLYKNLDDISFYQYIKAINESLQAPLNKWKKIIDISYRRHKGKKVFLIGPYLSDLSVVKKIEDVGGNIVGDDLTNSKRYFSSRTGINVKGNDIFEEIAKRMLSRHPSPTMNNFKVVLEKDIEEIKRKEVDGVIFIYQKFCEPHDYIYPLFKDLLDNKGIPSLKIQLENKENQADGVHIETFINMI